MIPSPCPGLIPCTPIPTAGPVGLTAAERIMVGDLSAFIFIAIVFLAIILALFFVSAAAWFFTRG